MNAERPGAPPSYLKYPRPGSMSPFDAVDGSSGRPPNRQTVADREAAKCIMEYGYGKPVQPLTGAFQEHRHRTLEVRWMPPRADDHSKCVDLAPGE